VTALFTRAFKVSKDGGLAGKTLAQLNQHALAACIELIQRDGKVLDVDKFTALKEGDVIVVTGRRNAVHQLQDGLADNEIALPEGYEVIEENRQLIADNRKLIGKSLQEIKEASNQGSMRGIYVTDYIREGNSIEMTPDLVVKKNDVIQLTGTAKDINRVEKNIGQRMGSANVTDLVVLGMGM
ncbi:TrkA C-terminal domain-containing protein, partial [Vibrio parahaemolyticus]|nr:TrkA C-terminal domain-containing protein [Vibrio parahaemolyticus]